MSSGQVARIILGLSILVVVAAIYLPHVFYTYSSSAVISGQVFTLTTPIKGTLKTELPGMGTELQAGDRIAVIEDETIDRAQVERFETEYNTLKQRLVAFQDEKAKLTKLKDLLGHSVVKYKDAAVTRIKIDVDRAKNRHKELLATVDETKRELARREKLLDKGFVSKAAYDAAYYGYERAVKAEEQGRLDVVRLLAEKEATEKGVYILFDGRKEFPYQEQRRHEIDMRLGSIESGIIEVRGRMDVIKKNLDLETERFNKLRRFELKAPVFSAVWRKMPAQGSHVDAFSPVVQLVDCSNIFVEMAIHERFFEKIHVGDVVEIRIAGTSKGVPGRVVALRGGSTPKDSTALAAVKRIRPHQEIEVFIKIDEKALSQAKGDFCHVGRNAEVIFKNRIISMV